MIIRRQSRCVLFAAEALCGVLLLIPSLATGQTTVNPRWGQFNASAGHNATNPDGTPVVQRYDVGLYFVGAAQPFQSVSIGKPSPDAAGLITVDLTAAFTGWPVSGVIYEADVAAVGPGGTARSARSNVFTFTQSGSCTFTVSTASQSVPAASGSYTTNVTTPAGCAWTAVSNASWITVTSGGSGTGSGAVGYSVVANTSTSARTGTLTIAGRTVTVTQAGASGCSFSLAPTTQSSPSAMRSFSATVTTTTGCTWTAASNSTNWITVTSGSNGTGSGTVGYVVAGNTSASARTGTLTIAREHADRHSKRRWGLQLQSGTDVSECCRREPVLLCRGDDDQRLRLDCREQQHQLDRRSQREQPHRQRDGHLHRDAQHVCEHTHRHTDDCRADADRPAGQSDPEPDVIDDGRRRDRGDAPAGEHTRGPLNPRLRAKLSGVRHNANGRRCWRTLSFRRHRTSAETDLGHFS